VSSAGFLTCALALSQAAAGWTTCAVLPNLNDFSVAQGFIPGNEKEVSFKSPINGALIAPTASHPGVNAWARENVALKLGPPPAVQSERIVRPEAAAGWTTCGTV
jgi:hypothetical protein